MAELARLESENKFQFDFVVAAIQLYNLKSIASEMAKQIN